MNPPSLQSGRKQLDAVWQAALPAAGYAYEVLPFGGECSVAEIARVAQAAEAGGAKAIVG